MMLSLRSSNLTRILIRQIRRACTECDPIKEETVTLKEENADLRDKYLRAIAETENLRRRSQKQIEDTKVFAIQSFCKDLLEVADILNLAIDSVDKSHVNSNPSMKSLFDGVTMTKEVLLNTFNRHGLVVISPEGERFDPNLHEAVFQVSKEHSKHAPDHIDQVLKIGYSLHGRPVRAAKVGVVKE